MTWRDVEAAAPELAELGRERLEARRVALLGTLRRDGSPRVSPVEPYLTQGELVFGAMAWSAKAADLLRDPRCVLHSAVTAPDSGEGELKLYGRADEAGADTREACREGWWNAHPPEAATVFALVVESATFIGWDLARGELTIRRWTPRQGYLVRTRRYP